MDVVPAEQRPAVEATLHEEVDRVLQGRLPTMADLPALPYVEQVVTEAMRLYPPAWIIGRRAHRGLSAERLRGAARGRSSSMSPYVMHRDAALLSPIPSGSIPDRWTPEFKAALPPFAYFPFGGGPRRCIGESFAWMELMLVVATIAQRWRLRARARPSGRAAAADHAAREAWNADDVATRR